MVYVSRFITFDKHLHRYTLAVFFDGENETLTFDTKAEAEREQARLMADGGEYLPPQLDGEL